MFYTLQTDRANSSFLISYPLRPREIVKHTITAIGADVLIRQVFSSENERTQFVVKSKPIVTIVPQQSKSLSWFLDIASRLENFFSLILGVSTALTNMRIRTNSKKGYFLDHRLFNAESSRYERVIRCTPEQLCKALERWFSVPDTLRQVENLIYGTIRNSSLFVETEFLSLAQAIESFHRVTDNSLLMAACDFKEVKRVLRGLIVFFLKTAPTMQNRLIESISHANELTFRDRIELLVDRLSSGNASRLLGDEAQFVKQLRDTRNHFTHPGISRKSTVLLEPLQLYNFNQRLHAFLRLLVLLYVGFQEEAVFESVFSQAPKDPKR